MVDRPVLVDLFCCGGGAAVGYARAGFDVVGVDVDPAPLRRYPFPSFAGDWAAGLDYWLARRDVAVVHASPPCQAYSVTKVTHDNAHPELVEPVRQALVELGLPYVIENVEGAPLINPLRLCGSEFNLTAVDVDGSRLQLRRHRLFESSVFLYGAGGCHHGRERVGGVYGNGGPCDRLDSVNPAARGGYRPTTAVRARLMGIDWLSNAELSQAIPPAYTEFIGEQLQRDLDETIPSIASSRSRKVLSERS